MTFEAKEIFLLYSFILQDKYLIVTDEAKLYNVLHYMRNYYR